MILTNRKDSQRETLADIICIMRSEPLYNPHGDRALVEANKVLKNYADRIEAARKRESGNAAALREMLKASRDYFVALREKVPGSLSEQYLTQRIANIDAALAAPPHKGKWKNGRSYEYEYAYCSECGRMQWAGWDTHKQAEENIESFSDNYRFCPGCGAEMDGGVYVK